MNRNVQYWRLIQPDGSPLPGRFPAQQVVNRLLQAPQNNQDLYRRCRDGMVSHGVQGSGERMLILDKVRRENLPSIGGSAGRRRAIGRGVDEGLLEPTYWLSADHNIVAGRASVQAVGPRLR